MTVINEQDRQQTAAALRAAAALIERDGYSPHPEYRERGICVSEALNGAAEMAGEFTDRLESAFAGWLQLRGAAPSAPGGYGPDGVISIWETANGGRAAAEVIAELNAAAAALHPGTPPRLGDHEIIALRESRALLEATTTEQLRTVLAAAGYQTETLNREVLDALAYGRACGSLAVLGRIIDRVTS